MFKHPPSVQRELCTLNLDHITFSEGSIGHIDQQSLEKQVASIRAVGILQPPLVEEIEDSRYQALAGEYCILAARALSLRQIPAIVISGHQASRALLALSGSLQTTELSILDLAQNLKILMKELKLSQRTLARHLGKKRSTITNYLRLLTLPEEMQETIRCKNLGTGHAKALLSLVDLRNQKILLDEILAKELTVRQAEARALELKEDKNKNVPKGDEQLHLEELQRRLSERFGTQVELSGREGRGHLKVHYYDLDDLDRILEILGE